MVVEDRAQPRTPVGRLAVGCRPFEMQGEFPPVVKASAELRERVLRKFEDQLR